MIPFDDVQFWLVTSLALAASVLLARPLLARRRKRAGCGSCAASAPPARKAT